MSRQVRFVGIDREIFEGAFEFQAAAAGEFQVAAGNFKMGGFGDGVAGFVGGVAVDADFAGEDQGLGFGEGFGQAAFDEELVEAFAWGFRFHERV